MKLVLKERKVLKENEDKTRKMIVMSAIDFLRLTTNEEIREYLIQRRKQFIKDKAGLVNYSQVQAESAGMYLKVNAAGKVIEHEGRNRALSNLNPDLKLFKTKGSLKEQVFFNPSNFANPEAKMKVNIVCEERNVNAISHLLPQYNGSGMVDIGAVKPVEKAQIDFEDPIGLGNQTLVLSDLILKAGEVFPNGKIRQEDYVSEDASKKAFSLFRAVFGLMFTHLRKQWGTQDYIRHDEVADATEQLVNGVYDIRDEKGPIKFIMIRGSYIHPGFERERVGDITIKKK